MQTQEPFRAFSPPSAFALIVIGSLALATSARAANRGHARELHDGAQHFQAGRSSRVRTRFELDKEANGKPSAGTPRNVIVDLPTGPGGCAPSSVPTCPMKNAVDLKFRVRSAAVREVDITLFLGSFPLKLHELVFNIASHPDEPCGPSRSTRSSRAHRHRRPHRWRLRHHHGSH